MRLFVRPADGEEWPALRSVRHEVFVVGQNVPAAEEEDGRDPDAVHFAATADGKVVGTARLRIVDGKGKFERFAVMPSFRGLGLGEALVRVAEAEARSRGLRQGRLHAQIQVEGFYERLGWRRVGEPFDEAGIMHVAMERSLSGS